MCRSPVILPPVVIRGTAAVALAAALVGCSAEADPTPLPPLPSVSPTPETLQVPPEATPATAQGAAAFARHYFELVNKALETGDATAVRGASAPGCGGCRNLIAAIEEPLPAGERVEGGLFELIFAESPPVEDGDVIVEIRYSTTEVRVFGPQGELKETIPATAATNGQLRLMRKSDGWVVQGFRGLP
jgi:hypothetical protein